jgi:6-phosphogluconate dehydrogenase (decarboxylating)
MKIGMIGLDKMGGVPAPVMATSVFTCFASEKKDSFQLKMVAARLNPFGGHAVTLESGAQGIETETPTP